jgi:hypothetical protein
VKTTSPEEAGELLMKREFPQILKSSTTPHDVIFIPEKVKYSLQKKFLNFLLFCNNTELKAITVGHFESRKDQLLEL